MSLHSFFDKRLLFIIYFLSTTTIIIIFKWKSYSINNKKYLNYKLLYKTNNIINRNQLKVIISVFIQYTQWNNNYRKFLFAKPLNDLQVFNISIWVWIAKELL